MTTRRYTLRPKRPTLPSPPRFFLTKQPRWLPAPTWIIDAPPPTWTGTEPEWLVYQWLIRHGLVDGVDFRYQVNEEGGRLRLFGSVVDFLINRPFGSIALRVQGYYWHYVHDPETRYSDFLRRQNLERRGFIVVDVLDLDLEDADSRERVLVAAMDGVELLLIGRFGGTPPTQGTVNATS